MNKCVDVGWEMWVLDKRINILYQFVLFQDLIDLSNLFERTKFSYVESKIYYIPILNQVFFTF